MREFKNNIFCEDCFDTMEEMVKQNFKVDLILTSPPYNTTRKGEVYNTQKARDKGYGRYDIYVEKTDEEYHQWTLDLFKLFDKILSRDGVILYNLSYSIENTELMWRIVHNIIENTNFTIADNIIWKKKSARPNGTSKNKLTRICEYIFVLCREEEFHTFRTNKAISKIGDNGQTYYSSIFNFIEAPNNDGKYKLNKATFSTELCLKLLDIYASPDSIVYDPFIGTGTTANACKIKRLTYIGSEISQEQVKYAISRLEYATLNEFF